MAQAYRCKIEMNGENFECYIVFDEKTFFVNICQILIIAPNVSGDTDYEVFNLFMKEENGEWKFENRNIESRLLELEKNLTPFINEFAAS